MSNADKIEEFQEILREDKGNHSVRRQLAVLLLDSGFSEEALQNFLYLKNIYPEDSGIYYNLGITYEKLKKLEDAERAYKKAIDLAPEEVDANYNLGLVYMDMQNYEDAIDNFERVLDVDNEDSNTYFNIGLSYFKLKQYAAAQYYFERTVEINPEDIYAHFYLGNILKDNGEKDLAVEKFNRVLEISPDYSWAYFNLAVIDYENGDFESAEQNLQKTLSLNPKDLEAYKVYAKLLCKTYKDEQALEVALQGLDVCGDNGDMYYILAQIYKRLDNFDEYKNSMELALKHYQSLSVMPKLLQQELSKGF